MSRQERKMDSIKLYHRNQVTAALARCDVPPQVDRRELRHSIEEGRYERFLVHQAYRKSLTRNP